MQEFFYGSIDHFTILTINKNFNPSLEKRDRDKRFDLAKSGIIG